MKWLRRLWAGLKHDLRGHRTTQTEGCLPAFDPTVPKGSTTYDEGSDAGR
jgi:hypothetical protein